MRKTIFLILFAFPLILCAQTIRVFSSQTDTPLFQVKVSSLLTKNQYTTNKDGIVKIPIKNIREEYVFSAIGYQDTTFTVNEIIALHYKIYLESLQDSLKEVIISNTKWAQKKKHIPKQFVKINPEDIQKTNPQTSADLLQKTGQVFVQKSQLGGGSPLIRGFAANRLLLSVDGIRMNTAIFRGGNLQNIISIDPLALDGVEVILGPGSVVYGSDAIGGALNFRTHTPKLSKKDASTLSGTSLYRFSSANSEQTIHADVNIGFEKWALASSITYSNFGDLKQGSNGPKDYLRSSFVTTNNGIDQVQQNTSPKKQVATDYEQYNFLQKLHYKPNKNWTVDLGLIYTTTSDYNRYDRLLEKDTNDQFKFAEWFYGPQRWLLASNMITYHKEHKLASTIKITNAYQFFEESRNRRNFGSQIRSSNIEKVHAYSLNIDAEKKLKTCTIDYGLEYIYNNVLSTANEFNILSTIKTPLQETRYPNGATWQSLAAYSIVHFDLNPKWNISLGTRYNQILLNADFQESALDFPFREAKVNTGALTGTLGTTYEVSKQLLLKGGFNTAFRAPNIDDIGKITQDSEPGTLVVPNPNLKSEYAYNGEIGGEYSSKKLNVSVAGYYTFLDNALTRDDFNLNGSSSFLFRGEQSNVLAVQNSTRLNVYGLETSLQFKVTNHLIAKGAYTITKGKETLSNSTKVPVRHVTPNFGNMHFIYKRNTWNIDAFVDFNEGFSFNELAPSEKSEVFIYAQDTNGNPFLPSWYTLNLRTQITLSKKILLSSAIENITDQRYRTYSSGISAPGINFITSLNYSF